MMGIPRELQRLKSGENCYILTYDIWCPIPIIKQHFSAVAVTSLFSLFLRPTFGFSNVALLVGFAFVIVSSIRFLKWQMVKIDSRVE